jgi:hypothetical protein
MPEIVEFAGQSCENWKVLNGKVPVCTCDIRRCKCDDGQCPALAKAFVPATRTKDMDFRKHSMYVIAHKI